MRNFFVTTQTKRSKTAKTIFAFAVFVCLIFSIGLVKIVSAQTASSTASSTTQLDSAQNERAQLESQLASLEAEIAQKEQDLKNQQGQSQSIQGDINILTSKITKAKLDIQAQTLIIQQLGGEITDKQNQIQTLSEKIASEKESLAQLIRNTNDLDQSTVIDLLLSQNSITQFYSDVNSYNSIQGAVKSSVDQILGLQSQTEDAKTLLQQQQDQAVNAEQAIEQNKAEIEQNQAEQKQLLTISKGKENQYKQILADRAAKVAAIQAKLFALAGGGKAINFQSALQYAKTASASTSVDPAFLMAILTQESNLGANVGRCYLTDQTTGAGVNATTGKVYPNVMKPSRDVPPFIQITQALGIDPMKQVVSCPIAGAGGWGGAMGPAQFIASTWELFVSRLQTALNVVTPNPWDPQDAFMASAMYLSDLGGINASYSAELRAACKYYGSGGSTCAYGRSVMKLAAGIQSDIDYLNQYGVTKDGS